VFPRIAFAGALVAIIAGILVAVVVATDDDDGDNGNTAVRATPTARSPITSDSPTVGATSIAVTPGVEADDTPGIVDDTPVVGSTPPPSGAPTFDEVLAAEQAERINTIEYANGIIEVRLCDGDGVYTADIDDEPRIESFLIRQGVERPERNTAFAFSHTC
jgi:hypothetical protein